MSVRKRIRRSGFAVFALSTLVVALPIFSQYPASVSAAASTKVTLAEVYTMLGHLQSAIQYENEAQDRLSKNQDVYGNVASSLANATYELELVAQSMIQDGLSADGSYVEITGAKVDDGSAFEQLAPFEDQGTNITAKAREKALFYVKRALPLKEMAKTYFKTLEESLSSAANGATTATTSVTVEVDEPPSGQKEVLLLVAKENTVASELPTVSIKPLNAPLPNDIRAAAGSDAPVVAGTQTSVSIPVAINNLGPPSTGATSPGEVEFLVSLSDSPAPISFKLDGSVPCLNAQGACGSGSFTRSFTALYDAVRVSVPFEETPASTGCAQIRTDILNQKEAVALQTESIQPTPAESVEAQTFNAFCEASASPLPFTEPSTATQPTNETAQDYTCGSTEVKAIDTWNGAAVTNGGTASSFTTNGPVCFLSDEDYHYNNGNGGAARDDLDRWSEHDASRRKERRTAQSARERGERPRLGDNAFIRPAGHPGRLIPLRGLESVYLVIKLRVARRGVLSRLRRQSNPEELRTPSCE